MTNYTDNGILFNVASVSLIRPHSYTFWDAAAKAGERFLNMASLLPEGAFLGWQLSAADKASGAVMAFSSAGAGLTAEDFAWVFETCGAVGPLSASLSDDLFSEHRWIYLLTPSAAECETENSFSRRERESRFTELLDMLTESGAILRIIARAGRNESRGEILLSLPQQLTLRMRTMLALTFPNTRPSALTAEGPACGLLPEDMLGNSMTELICALTKRDREKGDNDDLPAIDGESDFCFREDDEETYTPLEELELSIRTYNCLKRAGIYSVERLRALKDEDLRNIRNLGYKSMDEIKQKLAEIPPLSKPLLPAKESYREMLDDLIGLDQVKQQVKKIAAYAMMKRDLAALDRESLPIALNMEFTGNPGTAKTTVARIMAGILYEIGLLPDDRLIEVGRADLVGKYVGHTADKVKEIFKQAKGKLLFIDEAYSLVENRRGDYGDEAINTIVQEMENCREDTVVIFAGYPDEMKEFFSRNPGLRSRVPFTIHFSDYSAEELAQIAEAEAKKRGFSISSAAAEKLLSICRVAAQQPKLGNGRFCRNLIEDAILGYASRAYGGDGSPAARDFVLMADDFAAPDTAQFVSEQPRCIGFGGKE